MKSRLLVILTFLLTALLLTACPPTTQMPWPPVIETTIIIEEVLATLTPDLSLAPVPEIDYSMYPPGTVFFTDEDGSLANTRIVPELALPEWDAQDFPKGFSTTLHAGHWKKFLLGPASQERGYLVDVSPQEASAEGSEVVSMVMPEYDGEGWVDVLWLFQPKEAAPLPVYVRAYTTAGWPSAYHERLSLAPGVWQGYIFGKSKDPGGYVVAVNPRSEGMSGDTLQRYMINPEFPGGWQDVLRIQTLPDQASMQADVTIYRTPLGFLKTEATLHLQPGEWAAGILGLSDDPAAYVMKVTPLSETDNQVESYGVEPVFMDGAWRDVFRVRIPADRPPMDVKVSVYAVTPSSDSEQLAQVPSTTPDRVATELAAYIFDTPAATATQTPSLLTPGACPGALPSRLQVGGSGIVSLEPPVANRVRSDPDRDAQVLGQLMPGEKFTVLDGPRCADGWTWWFVRSRAQELEGWTSEGDAETYWLQPAATPTPTVTPTRLANVDGCFESPAGLVSWWPGDGNAEDIQGTNDGMLINGASFAGGKVGQAFSFDGTNRVVASTAALPIFNSDRTMALWVKADAFLEGEAFFAGYGRFKSYSQAYELGAAGSTLFFSQWGEAIFGPALQTGRWYHVAVTNTYTKVKLYLDGKLVASGDLPIDTAAGTKLFIGSLPDEPAKRLDGLVDEVEVFNRALTAAEIRAIYQAGSQGQCESETEDVSSEQNVETLTANQVIGANDIEAAIKRATADGTRPGTVILDGRNGAFVYTVDDRSINIFVSNLTLLGVNQAVIKNCADGLYFDDFPLKHIKVEGIEFICDGSGVVANGAFEDVTLRDNIFRAGNSGIDIGGASSHWLITENVIEAVHTALVVTGAQKIEITNNQISGNTGIILRQCSESTVQKNVIKAADQGILLSQESWKNLVQMNTIQGVSHSGITLEAGVTGNQILDNTISCAPGTSRVKIEAAPEVVKMNTIHSIAEEDIVYSNDFEISAGAEWSQHHLEFSPTGKKFLGQFGTDEVSLNLTNLAAHTEIRVVFEVYVIRSWDGNVDPDIWQFEVDGRSWLRTTFDNQDFYQDHSQAYPDTYQVGSHPPRTGAKENNTLGYQFSNRQMDSIYLLNFTIPHTSTTLKLTFTANGLMQELLDESWGIDNIVIYTIK
jgi:hypothetical protein